MNDKQDNYQENQENFPPFHTFMENYFCKQARIEHFESLRKEVEVQKAEDEKAATIDWKGIVEKYKNNSW